MMSKTTKVSVWFAVCVAIGLGMAIADGVSARAVVQAAMVMAILAAVGITGWMIYKKVTAKE
jgi:hypothetical protein